MIESQGRTVVGDRHGAKSLTARNSVGRLVASVIWSRENLRFVDIVYPFFFVDYKQYIFEDHSLKPILPFTETNIS